MDFDDELIGLLARCAIKDQQALRTLYDRVAPKLNGVAYRLVRSDELSNDILQEAFIQIWTNASSYRPHLARPMTWLCSIVRYRALDRLERERTLGRRFVYEHQGDVPELAGGEEPEHEAERQQGNEQLSSCMDALSQDIRASVRLAYLYGYSRDEIAEKLVTNSNTVKSWLRRGAERLKQCLQAVRVQVDA